MLGAKGWGFVPLPKHVAFFWAGSVFASWIQRPTSVSQPRFIYLENSCKLLHSCSCWKRMKTSLVQSRQMAGGQTASVKGHPCFVSECSCVWAHVVTKKQAFKMPPPISTHSPVSGRPIRHSAMMSGSWDLPLPRSPSWGFGLAGASFHQSFLWALT